MNADNPDQLKKFIGVFDDKLYEVLFMTSNATDIDVICKSILHTTSKMSRLHFTQSKFIHAIILKQFHNHQKLYWNNLWYMSTTTKFSMDTI